MANREQLSTGETNLQTLLKSMKPVLNTGSYVFCNIQKEQLFNVDNILFFFKETEANTLVMKQEQADLEGYTYTGVFAWISLTVHSSLEAIGLTAAFSTALAKHGISCNVVAAYYHDHIFVPTKDAEKALMVLREFGKSK
jgi:uncharacterized protein